MFARSCKYPITDLDPEIMKYELTFCNMQEPKRDASIDPAILGGSQPACLSNVEVGKPGGPCTQRWNRGTIKLTGKEICLHIVSFCKQFLCLLNNFLGFDANNQLPGFLLQLLLKFFAFCCPGHACIGQSLKAFSRSLEAVKRITAFGSQQRHGKPRLLKAGSVLQAR